MRLIFVMAAAFPCAGTMAMAQTAPVLSVTQVSYSMPAGALDDLSADGFVTNDTRDVAFDLGRPDGSGARDTPVVRVTPRATVRVAQNRTKRAFHMPWQTGVFQ